jgi:hypothetical protein
MTLIFPEGWGPDWHKYPSDWRYRHDAWMLVDKLDPLEPRNTSYFVLTMIAAHTLYCTWAHTPLLSWPLKWSELHVAAGLLEFGQRSQWRWN